MIANYTAFQDIRAELGRAALTSALRSGLGLPRPAEHLRRPRQPARPGAPGPAARHRRSSPSTSAPTSRCPRDGDIYLLGGGEDRPQVLAAAAAARRRRPAPGRRPRRASSSRCAPATSCSAPSSAARRASPCAGLGLLDIRSGRGERRAVGEIVGDVDPALGLPALTGFENHQGVTHARARRRPAGPGAARRSATATAPRARTRGRILGTYMHGPALARNPASPTCCSAGRRARCGRCPPSRGWARRAPPRAPGRGRPVLAGERKAAIRAAVLAGSRRAASAFLPRSLGAPSSRLIARRKQRRGRPRAGRAPPGTR